MSTTEIDIDAELKAETPPKVRTNGAAKDPATVRIAPTSSQILAGSSEDSVFAKYRPEVYPFRYQVTLLLNNIVGGVPKDPKVAERWIATKVTTDRDDIIRDMVMAEMVEVGTLELDDDGEITQESWDKAIAEAAKNKNMNGFKRLSDGQLHIEGRHVKAMIKEAANIHVPKQRWGPTNKGTKGFFAEHIFVEEDIIPLWEAGGTPVTEDSELFEVQQRFISTWRGTGIQLEEIVHDCYVSFHVRSDYKFSEEDWAGVLLTGEYNGLGSARSQSFGRFSTVGFDQVDAD